MLTTIIIFAAILSLLILVHELGHFWAARRAGIWVEEFGFGIPPRIYGKKIGETIYSINLLPFGGFVRLHGESSQEGVTKPKRAFVNKSKKTRSLILVSGVVMNFILAIAAFAVVYSFFGIPRESNNIRIIEVSPESPAQEAGLQTGDIVRFVNDQSVATTTKFLDITGESIGSEVTFKVERSDGGVYETVLVPRDVHPDNEGPIGATITTVENYFPPVWQRPFYGIYYGFKEAVFWGREVVIGFSSIILNLFKGEVPKGLAGPVGIFAITSEAAKFGILALVNFVGILSVNLAILNIIPFPALDGGRLLFIGIESVVGKKVLPKIEATAHTVGFIILILMLLAVTVHDVRRLIDAGGISGFLDTVLR